jgi:poly(glycerol-phosphate) alpha-glucosyltransferase
MQRSAARGNTVPRAMPRELPAGRYLSCAFEIDASRGGETRALLMRNRMLAREGGVRPDVLMVAPAADMPERRAALHEHGLLSDGVRLLSLHEHYREHGWGDLEPSGPLADLGAHREREETASDGSPWRTVYRLPDAEAPVSDYLRPDGTPYLRIGSYRPSRRATWPKRIERVGPDGTVVGPPLRLARLIKRWIRDLTADDERVFLFVDTRFLAPVVAGMSGARFHVLYQLHNLHTHPPYRWDSPMSPAYERVFAAIDGVDALVALTERQRDDIALRRGRTSNMCVIPNPVDPPAAPDPAPERDPRRVVTMARLERQKRVDHAIAAFARVAAELPDARLDIYGRGDEEEALRAEIARHGLDGVVRLRGFDPDASEALWRASAFLLSSLYEGYPLSTIEAMARGCPVVSYDIRYGPREQISDGVDGFLVPEGDVDALAARIVELLRAPELVARMGAAALASARRRSPHASFDHWSAVLAGVIERKPRRTRIEGVALEVERLRELPFGRIGLDARVTLTGSSKRAAPADATLSLAAIDRGRGELTELPLRVRIEPPRSFALRARLRRRDLPGGGDAYLRLLLTWENSAWQTELAELGPGAEVRPLR